MSELEQQAETTPSLTVGELLRKEREGMHLDAADVARQLRLGLRQVEALEANDFAALPGNTIVRGFIRNYAKLLSADPTQFLAAYEASLPAAEAPRIATDAENIDISPKASRRWLYITLGVIAVLVATPVLIYALLHDDGRQVMPIVQAPATTPGPAAAPAGEAVVAVPLPAVQPMATVPLETPAEASASTAAPAAAATPEDKPKPDAAKGSIVLAFEEDAWVEIRDRSGQRLYSQIGRKGASDTVDGERPFSVVIGNAAKVRLVYKGKPVDLAPFIKVNVARLTLE